MVLTELTQANRYEALHPLFPAAFRFLATADLHALPDGKTVIDGDKLFAIVSRNGTSQQASKLEAHNGYIDIHVAVSGSDAIGWKPRRECLEPVDSFNDQDDYILYDDQVNAEIPLPEKHIMILYPEDAHAPLLKTKDLFKIVLKIKLQP